MSKHQQQLVLEGYYPFAKEVDIESHRLDKKVFKRYVKRHNVNDLAIIQVKRVFIDFIHVIEVFGVVNLTEEGFAPFFVSSGNIHKIKSLQS